MKTERLDLRITASEREILQEASRAEHTSLTNFVLSHATRAAENVLADRRLFQLSATRWEAFVQALDEPPREHPRLRKLLESPSVLGEE